MLEFAVCDIFHTTRRLPTAERRVVDHDNNNVILLPGYKICIIIISCDRSPVNSGERFCVLAISVRGNII